MAAGKLPGILVKVGADTRDAIDGLNKVNRAIGSAGSMSSRLSAQFNMLKPAIAGAAVAFGALATKISVDAIQAAVEEEQSVSRLTTTMRNLGLAAQDTKVEAWIDDLQFATGVADNQMRPAYDRLIRSIGDVDEANQALALSLDIAVAKGRDVQQVADVMGKAYDGNTMALSRMGVGIDRTILKTGNMERITSALTAKFGGQADAAANTLGGAIKGVGIGWDELVESFGNGLVGSTTDDIKELKNLQTQLRDMQPSAEAAGQYLRNIALGAVGFIDRIGTINQALEDGNFSQAFDMLKAGARDDDKEFQRLINDYKTMDYVADSYATEMGNVHQALRAHATLARQSAAGARDDADALDEQKTAADRLKQSLDRLNGQNRSILGNRLSLRELRRNGPNQSGSRKVADPSNPETVLDAFGIPHSKAGTKDQAFATKDDALSFGIQYAQGVEALVTSVQDKMLAAGAGQEAISTKVAGIMKHQRTLLSNEISPILGIKSTRAFLSEALATPAYIQHQANAENWRRAMAPILPTGSPMSGGTITYIANVNVQGGTPAEVMRKMRDWRRYQAAGPAGQHVPFNAATPWS